MNYASLLTKEQNFLMKKIAEDFFRAIRLIENVSDDVYANIGGHFRHNLDFANVFLNGLETGKIDYGKRERNEKVEQNRAFALEQILFLIRRMQRLPNEVLTKEIAVCSEIDETVWHASSVMRELEFLHSHTVHHHALIAEKLTACGLSISNDFGVAPSTLKFWKERKKAA